MRTFYALIVVTFSIATILLYARNPALSSSSIEYEHTDDRPSVSVSKGPKKFIDEIDNDDDEDDDDEGVAPPIATKKSKHSSTSDVSATTHPQDTPKGLHLCTCLDPNKNDPDAEIPKRLRWLHFPKTGTSFISTLWSYACSTRERYIDLEISSFQCDIYTRNAYSMYDFALMK
jgi:hypothetical protein